MFIIQDNFMRDEYKRAIVEALASNNIPHKFVSIMPFTREISSDEPLSGTNFIPYGSTLMTMLAHNLNWRGNYFVPNMFRIETRSENRDDMLNNASMTLEHAIEFLKLQDPLSQWFTRPCEDLKQYSGQVINAGGCWQWMEDAMTRESSGSYKLSADTKVVISCVKNIQAEWRWFVVDGKVVSGSIYRSRGQLVKRRELDDAIISEAQTIADIWLPHRNCCMDLARVNDKLKVIEFNTINSSGFYDNDVNVIFKSLWDDFVIHQ